MNHDVTFRSIDRLGYVMIASLTDNDSTLNFKFPPQFSLLSLPLCCEAFYIGGAGSLSPPTPLSRSTPIPPPLAPPPPQRHLPRLRHFEDFIMSDESVEIETHAEGQDEFHFGGQSEGPEVDKKKKEKKGGLGGLMRRLSSFTLFPRQRQRRTLSWRRRKSEGPGKSPSSPSSFRALLVPQQTSKHTLTWILAFRDGQLNSAEWIWNLDHASSCNSLI